MRKHYSITVGVSAYNESTNIAVLLRHILDQQLENFVLDKIIVISDASDDTTVRVAKSVADQRIKVINGKRRCGVSLRQNQIFSLASTDIVVLLNADILPANEKLLEELCLPFISNEGIGLVGARVIPQSRSNTIIGKVLDWHHLWKNDLFEKINEGDNVYLCHGRARAFSKKLYSNLRWPSIADEDAYSYMQAKNLGFDFVFASKAKIWFTSPQTLSDYMHQSARFFLARKSDDKSTQTKNQQNWYRIPKYLLITSALKAAASHPAHATIYAMILTAARVKSLMSPNQKKLHLWHMSPSTKTFSYNNL